MTTPRVGPDGHPVVLAVDPAETTPLSLPIAVGAPQGVRDPGTEDDAYGGASRFPALFRLPTPVAGGVRYAAAVLDGESDSVVILARTTDDRTVVTLDDAERTPFTNDVLIYDGNDRLLGYWQGGQSRFIPMEDLAMGKDVHGMPVLVHQDDQGMTVLCFELNIDARNRYFIPEHSDVTAPNRITVNGKHYFVEYDHTSTLRRLTPLEPEAKKLPPFPDLFPALDIFYDQETGLISSSETDALLPVNISLAVPGLPNPTVTSGPKSIVIRWSKKNHITISMGKNLSSIMSVSPLENKNATITNESGGVATYETFEAILNSWRSEYAKVRETYVPRLRPPLAEMLAPAVPLASSLTPEDVGALLDARAAKPRNGITRYERLNQEYHPDSNRFYVPNRNEPKGVSDWGDALAVARAAVERATPDEQVEIVLNTDSFSSAVIPEEALEALADLAHTRQDRTLTIVTRGNPLDPENVTTFTRRGTISSFKTDENGRPVLSEPARSFWASHAVLKEVLIPSLAADASLRTLFGALYDVDGEMPHADLGTYLDEVSHRYNEGAAAGGYELIPPNRRTLIYLHLDRLRDHLRLAVQNGYPGQTSPGRLFQDPVSTLRMRHPPNDDPLNHCVIVGGGAMGSADAVHIRRRIDKGELPLDFRVTVFDHGKGLVYSVNHDGMHGREIINGKTDSAYSHPLYYANPAQYNETMVLHPAAVEEDSLKASDLAREKRRPYRLASARRFLPDAHNPSKSFIDGDWLIPYADTMAYYRREGAEDLIDLEDVAGGYASGPDVWNDLEVYRVFVAGTQKGVDRIRYVMGDHNIEYFVGREMALTVQLAGALKNTTTFYSGRRMAAAAFSFQRPDSHRLSAFKENEVKSNIEIIEETIAHIAPRLGLETDHITLPYGVKKDVEKCLDISVDHLSWMHGQFEAIVTTGDLNRLDAFILALKDAKSSDLWGTRNPRDGIMREAIYQSFAIFRLADLRADTSRKKELTSYLTHLMGEAVQRGYTPEEASAYVTEMFYWAKQARTGVLPKDKNQGDYSAEHLPSGWKQEGANGIGPLMNWSDRRETPLPAVNYHIWNNYHPESPRVVVPMTAIRAVTEEDHPAWGFPNDRIQNLGQRVIGVQTALNSTLADDSTGDLTRHKQFFLAGLDKLSQGIPASDASPGVFPEIDRRLRKIHGQLGRLHASINANGIPPKKGDALVRQFTSITQAQVIPLFTTSPPDSPSVLSARLRALSKSLGEVEKNLEAAKKPDLEDEAEADPLIELALEESENGETVGQTDAATVHAAVQARSARGPVVRR